MESPDLNPRPAPPDDAALTAFLARAQPPLPDDGFSARVVAALPAPRRAPLPVRPLLTAVAALAGAALSWRQFAEVGGSQAVTQQFNDVLDGLQLAANHTLGPTPTANLPAALSLAIGVSAVSLLYTFRHRLPVLLPVWLRF